jgi:hypothetical protein
MPQFPAVIELSELDGTNGFAIAAPSGAGEFGIQVASAGDINGDGFDDLMVAGTRFASVVFGSRDPFDATFDVATLDGDNGFNFDADIYAEFVGLSIAGIGDINGDGIDDVMIGSAIGYNGYSYMGYVVLGTTDGFQGSLTPSDLSSGLGFQVRGPMSPSRTGEASGAAGDVNGDGFDDFIIGTYQDQSTESGAAYVVFGKASFGGILNVGTLDGNNGFRFDLPEHAHSTYGSLSGGDVNGDGFSDIMIGSRQLSAYPTAGHAYVIYGSAGGFAAVMEPGDLDGNNGFSIEGAANYDYAGTSVSLAGDINGDGIADMAVGARGVDENGTSAGATYIVFGATGGFGSSLALSGIDGTNGFKILGALPNDGAGRSVDVAGDFNGDGYGDILIGASGVDTNGSASGAAYVVFGSGGGFAAVIDLADLDGNNGFTINGIAEFDGVGRSVASAGDINGDGFDDIMVGAPFRGASDTGEAYVVYGIAPDEAVHRVGTVASQTLAGGAFKDTLEGLGGDDHLFGNAGKDALDGGADRDVLKGGAGKDAMTGGGGADVFVYTKVGESTSKKHDTIFNFNFDADQFDLASEVTGVDTAISTGALSKATFDADLAAAVDGAHLGKRHAVIFTADAGELAGKVFLIVDGNKTAGYQAGQDLVIRLDTPINTAGLDVSDFF